MRVLVACRDEEATSWLEGVLLGAGLSVVVLAEVQASSPELGQSELLIADSAAADQIGDRGPERRLLLVPRGEAVDLSRAMSGGFMDLLVVPAPEDEILGRVGRALDHFLKPGRPPIGDRDQIAELREITERVTTALERPEGKLDRSAHELAEGMLSVFVLLIDSHETTEQGVPGHSRRVGSIARRLARALGKSEEEASWLELAGRLHDIGTLPLGLPLMGEAPLSRELRRGLQRHPEISVEILEPLAAWGLPVDAVRNHHERVDGSGYPRGLEGEEVSLDAQILGAADVLEALTSRRPWRDAESSEGAIEAMRSGGGFTDDVLDALERVAAEEIGPPGPLPGPPKGEDG